MGINEKQIYTVKLFFETGNLFASVENVSFDKNNCASVKFPELKPRQVVSVSVKEPNNQNATNICNIKWYKKETGEFICSGSSLRDITEGTEIICRISLPDSLEKQYTVPAQQEITVGKNNSIDIVLSPIPKVKISGSIKNDSGKSIPFANVSILQTMTDKASENVSFTADSEGRFSITVANVPLTFSVSESGYKKYSYKCNAADADNLNIILHPMQGIKVSCNLQKKNADADSPESLFGNTNIRYTVKINNREITDYSAEYPNLIIPQDKLTNGSVVAITAEDSANEYISDTKSFTYSSDGDNSVTLTLVQKGSISVTPSSDEKGNTLLIFNKSGENVQTLSLGSVSTNSKLLDAGNYTVVIIKKSDRLFGVSTLELFDNYGLRAGKDYFRKDVTVENGKITDVSGFAVPTLDESIFVYTVEDETSFSTSSTSIYSEQSLLLKATYSIDTSKVSSPSDMTVSFSVPAGFSVKSNSVTVDNLTVTDYFFKDNVVTIPVGKSSATVRAYVSYSGNISDKDVAFSADLLFKDNGKSIRQPIGSFSVGLNKLNFTLDEATCSTKNVISGKIVPDSVIHVYDNDCLVATGQSNKVGSFSISFELANADTYFLHEIYLRIETSKNDVLISQTKIIEYNPDLINISKVSITYNGKTNTIDYSSPQNNNAYFTFVPSIPTVVFRVEFSDNDPERISEVYVIATGINTKNYVPLTYSEKNNCWIGSYNFDSSSFPRGINVSFNSKNSDTLHITTEEMKKAAEKSDAIIDYFSTAENLPVSFEITKNTKDSNGYGTFSGKITTSDGSSLNVETTKERLTNSDRSNPKGTPVENNGNKYYYDLSHDNNGYTETITDMEDGSKTTNKYQGDLNSGDPGSGNPGSGSYDPTGEIAGDFISVLSPFAPPGIGDLARGVAGRRIIEQAKKIHAQIMYNLEHNECLSELTKENIRNLADADLGRIIELCSMDGLGTFLNCILGFGINAIGNAALSWASLIRDGLDSFGFIVGTRLYMMDLNTQLHRSRATKRNGYYCVEPPEEPDEPKPIGVTIDPSGFVCEGVESNRLSGVTVTCFYSPNEDGSDAVLWDAEEYDQSNPLLTDENGHYEWFVPDGYWLVRYEKEGYETTYSEWLPVPPPQTEVNCSMVSVYAPEVKSVKVYNDEIEIKFSQFMNVDSVNSQSVSVIGAGNTINGSLVPVNPEKSFRNENITCADTFLFVPDDEQTLSGEYSVSIQSTLNYAGAMQENEFSKTITVESKMQSLVSEKTLELETDSFKTVTVQITPAQAGASKTVIMESDNELIASVSESNCITDENGCASFRINGNLYGKANLTCRVKDSDFTAVTVVTVNNKIETCKPVTSSIENGATVDAGTYLTLATETAGASIFYTTDSTCPCIIDSPSRLSYTGPIQLTKSVRIIAYAVKDGYYESQKTILNITVMDDCSEQFFWDKAGENADNGYKAYTVKYGDKLQIPEPPERKGFTFAGWYDWNTDSLVDLSNETMNSVDGRKFYAKWTVNQYTISYYSEGEDYFKQTYDYGAEIILPESPEKEGYSFTGWKWKQGLLTAEISQPTNMPDSNLTANAVFEPNTYEAKLMVDGKLFKAIKYTYGQNSLALPDVPKKEGYIGKWESFSLTIGGVTVNAVYELIPSLSIKGYSANIAVDLKSTCVFNVNGEIPDGYTVRWSCGEVSNGGKTCTLEYITEKETKVFCWLEKDGKMVEGTESGVVTITVNTGFFARFIAFFRGLFGSLPVYIDNKKQ